MELASVVVHPSGSALMSATSSSSTVRRGLPRTVIAFVLLAAAVLIWAGYSVHWSWTGLSDNDTLWDWMKLLVLPLSLAAVPLWLQSHQKMSWTRRGTLVVGATAFSIFVPLGYLLHWKWTGFAGNTLWDWLELLLLPIVIATVKFWTAERTIQARHRIAAAAVVMGFAAFTACAYLLPITWSGFAGNTLWDWVKLLFIPILMPLVLVPAVTEWINAGVAEETDDADQIEELPAAEPNVYPPTTYEIWLTPTEKITAEILPPDDPADAPQLVVGQALSVHRLTADEGTGRRLITTAS